MGVLQIGEIDFLDVKVKVYLDESFTLQDSVIWKARNPDSFYQGIMYINHETGKVSYPEGAIIPEQTKRDREIIPTAVITNKSFDKLDIAKLKEYFESDHKIRNGL